MIIFSDTKLSLNTRAAANAVLMTADVLAYLLI